MLFVGKQRGYQYAQHSWKQALVALTSVMVCYRTCKNHFVGCKDKVTCCQAEGRPSYHVKHDMTELPTTEALREPTVQSGTLSNRHPCDGW